MGKSAVKSVRETTRLLRSSVAVAGGLCPQNSENSDGYDADSGDSSGYLCPRDRRRRHHAFLDGNFVRRELPLKPYEYCVWDTELPGFGLRISPTGRYYWTVRLRHRGKQRRVSLGRTDDVDATFARAQARRLLAEVALDGLPKRPVVKETPTMTDYVTTYWPDLARGWKASTAKRNLHSWKCYLEPHFGSSRVWGESRHCSTRNANGGFPRLAENICRSGSDPNPDISCRPKSDRCLAKAESPTP
ncbi:MAG: DUF4102 domain-containing protein [Porphyrobacter sp. IPPAS B-1204]|nr:MAG: DUF4102 domain-containing protein [Porphyrobacter sp. IPPAS B-1204]